MLKSEMAPEMAQRTGYRGADASMQARNQRLVGRIVGFASLTPPFRDRGRLKRLGVVAEQSGVSCAKKSDRRRWPVRVTV
jgi:hypothetical protein